MKRFFLLCAPIFLCGLALPLVAQDASMVLRTSVTFNSQKATLSLSDDQKRQADELLREAQAANRSGKYGDAMRSLYQGLAVMRGFNWTPSLELVSGLQGKLDHAITEPGAKVVVTLTPLYSAPRAAELKLKAFLTLASTKKDGSTPTVLGSPLQLDAAAGTFRTQVTLPDAAPGDYVIEVRLSDGAETPAAGPFLKLLPLHVDHLTQPVKQLRERLAKAPKKEGLATAEYALTLYENADNGDVSPARVNFREEFAAANAILDALDAGRDPFAGKRGDAHRAYRSAVDDSLQPYRLFIPASYDPAKGAPLVVALHGMGGDENALFELYENGRLKREAERLGFLVVCPKGRDSASMYQGSAERDVMDVLAEVQRMYRVDPRRIYLMGHSMGAYGTWSVAMNHPDVFAALGPISGGGSAAGMVKIRHIPQYVVHGDDDRTVNVRESRTMVEAGKKAGAEITYVEVAGGSHVSVAAPAFAPMFDFFARQAKAAK